MRSIDGMAAKVSEFTVQLTYIHHNPADRPTSLAPFYPTIRRCGAAQEPGQSCERAMSSSHSHGLPGVLLARSRQQNSCLALDLQSPAIGCVSRAWSAFSRIPSQYSASSPKPTRTFLKWHSVLRSSVSMNEQVQLLSAISYLLFSHYY
jgi:hypothetical protein